MKQRSTIRWHGEPPTEDFTVVPNELARDGYLSAPARSIAFYLWTHSNGFKVSASSLATYLKMRKQTVVNALNELIEHGWLTRIECTGPNGGIYGYQYFANRSGRIRHRTGPHTDHISTTNTRDDVLGRHSLEPKSDAHAPNGVASSLSLTFWKPEDKCSADI
jgi:hypothetical protein